MGCASYEESKSGIEKVESELGAIDVVVANAGILRDAPFHRMTPDQWNEVIATNLTECSILSIQYGQA